jgi:hypothetical protein
MTNDKNTMVIHGRISELGDHGSFGPSISVEVLDSDGRYCNVVLPTTRAKLSAMGACLYRKMTITITVEED